MRDCLLHLPLAIYLLCIVLTSFLAQVAENCDNAFPYALVAFIVSYPLPQVVYEALVKSLLLYSFVGTTVKCHDEASAKWIPA